jgi:PTS system mannose-specific IIA component
MNSILIIAHAFPDCADGVVALDVQPHTSPEETFSMARIAMEQMRSSHFLVLTDVFGATPCNVAQKLVDGVKSKLITGVNLPMLLRTVSYRHESLEALVSRALIGGSQGIMQVAITAPQNQARKKHDQSHYDHQQ